MARRAAPASQPVVLADPSAVRALAHPARLVVIDALYAGQVLTATECAALAGTTPSAMSYHLRQLEKFGLVVRAEARDGRERPWARAGETLSISFNGPAGSTGTLAAAEVLVDSSLQLDRERMLATMRADADEGRDGPWSGTSTYAREQLLLTPDEARALREKIEELTSRYTWEKRQGRPPKGAATFGLTLMLAREIDPG